MIGMVLLIVFAVMLGLFPVEMGGGGHIVLPAATLGLPFTAYIADSPAIRWKMPVRITSARHGPRNVPEHVVVLKRTLKNGPAGAGVISVRPPPAAMTGSFVIGVRGAGGKDATTKLGAVLGKDVTLMLGVVLVLFDPADPVEPRCRRALPMD